MPNPNNRRTNSQPVLIDAQKVFTASPVCIYFLGHFEVGLSELQYQLMVRSASLRTSFYIVILLVPFERSALLDAVLRA